MASNVVVIDSTARRATIKVTPQTHLSDVLTQACTKLGVRAENYGLKHNKKQVDLSLTYRLSGLPSGAQLELVQSSRSPTVVNVALQFAQADKNLRFTEKFPSSTSLWQILRRFESGSAGGNQSLNITQRGIASTNSGSGRLFYEMPTLSLMSREFSTFVDLQKTLAQIGVTSGSAMFRLNFTNSGKPLETAMQEISQYFKETEEVPSNSASAKKSPEPVPVAPASESAALAESSTGAGEANLSSALDPMEDVTPTAPIGADAASSPTQMPATTKDDLSSPHPLSQLQAGSRNISVFSAPTSAPVAVATTYNEADYIPTVDHAKSHQARLETLGKNSRLLSDKELEVQRQEREAKLKAVTSVRVRFRMPDQTQIQSSFGRNDTAQALFSTLKDVVRVPADTLVLSYRDASGKQQVVDTDSKKKLIEDLGWTGDTLANVSWLESVSDELKKGPVLRDEYLAAATQLRAETPKDDNEPEKTGGFLGSMFGNKDKDKEKKSKMSSEDREAKMKKLLGFGKK